ncbi:MAG: SNF2-related protein [Rothia sp. (in: high G+C Gram-positive bacteria)]|nr:SNF2-related protein [Rothia sp. (in: high G+C Gram-positive bacteria)]
MTEEMIRRGEQLLHTAEQSRAVLGLLAKPAALSFDLPADYAGSLYRFAPLNPANITGATTWLQQAWWKQRSPVDFDLLRELAGADTGLTEQLNLLKEGQGGFFSRIFGGAKKQAADAAAAELNQRLANTDAALSRAQALFAQAAEGIPTVDAAFAANTLGFKDAVGTALARFAGERWEQVTWEQLPEAELAAYQGVWAALNTAERAQLIGGMSGDMEALKTERARITLRDIPVDKLRDLTTGTVRTAPLTSAGITTVEQVLARPVSALTGIPGVGETTAAQIYAAAQRLLAEAVGQEKENLGEQRTPAAERMLIGVHRLAEIDAAIPNADLLQRLSGYTPLLSQNLTPGAPLYLALGDDRTDYDQLSEDLAWCSANQGIRIPEANWLTPNQAWSNYLADPAHYQALLAHYLGNENQGDTYLPADVNERIRKYPIDLNGLAATLRGYQNYGAKFMLAQKKTILGDEMGLGKTMQSLAVLTHLKNKGKTHFLVISPASVVINWARETEKFTTIPVFTAHGDDRETQVANWKANGGMLIATYDGARLYADETWRADALIADEAHLVKNAAAQRSQTVAAIARRTEYVVLLSGTPMENRVSEFVTLVDYLQPELVAEPGMDSLLASEFRTRIAPAYLRRNQQDVLSELPDMSEHRDWVELTPADQDNYRAAVADGNFSLMRRAAWVAPESAKQIRLGEILEDAAANDRKVIIFSFFLSVLDSLEAYLGERSVGTIKGSVPVEERQKMVDALGQAPGGSVLLIQITAGGAGLNIQAASVVIFCEPQFKPTIEAQAIARAHRMGQTRSVDVYRLLGADTVDERMLQILGHKSQLFDEYARISAAKDSDAQSVDISDSKLAAQIIAEERRRLGLDETAEIADSRC